MTRQRTMIVGATGMLGSAVIAQLGNNHDLVQLRRESNSKPPAVGDIRIANLLDPISLRKVTLDVETILFFPSFSTPTHSPRDPARELTATLPALSNLIEACACNGRLPHVIFSSSGGALYGDADTACSEEAPLAPGSSYALGKLLSEELLKFYARIGKIRYTILRFSNLYGQSGPRMVLQGIIDRFLDDAILRRTSAVWTSLDTTRDYLFVDDAARAVAEVLRNPSLSCDKIFNVGSGCSSSIGEILWNIRKVTDGIHKYTIDEQAYSGPQSVHMDSRIFKKTYPEWGDPRSLHDGIAVTWNRKIKYSSANAAELIANIR